MNSRRAVGAMAIVSGAMALLASGNAYAQADVRMIRPNVLLLLDTSGSMEWRTGVSNTACIGADGGPCNRCSNGVSMCAATCPAAEQRNRWTTAVEVLTGTIQNFSCAERARTVPADYDYLYPLPYHEPLSNGYALWSANAAQTPDGVLDAYKDRVRFGLMTFDNDYRIGIQANDGMFSYGRQRNFLANGCMGPSVQINVGSRRSSFDQDATDPVPGGLISVGAPLADTITLGTINDRIQKTITGYTPPAPRSPVPGIRPYGGTPIAGMLEDALDYWRTSSDVTPPSGTSGDPYHACRARYNILITDGQPNMDFRPACEGGTGECPYNLPEQTAMTMAIPGTGQPGAKTFVIAFNATDPGAVAALAPIAVAGGSTNVLYAADRTGLQTALSSVLDSISAQTSTRTAPAFGMSASGATNTSLYQFQSSFAVAAGLPWEGVLERRRSECIGSPPAPMDQDIDRSRDDFGYLLRHDQRSAHGWGPRHLWTYVPTGATTAAQLQTTMRWTSGQPTRVNLDGSIPPGLFNVATTTERDALYAWLRGDAGTLRQTRPLGDIFHSNPVVIGAPGTSLLDQTYAGFRARTLPLGGWRNTAKLVGTREPMVYVGTNDGVLHAFNSDTGEEAWGFVPPYLTGAIRSMYPANHQYGVDGTPIVQDMIYTRSAIAVGDANSWHSVLVVGLRGGGGAYVALDVTDPYDPKFLWQFTDVDMVNAYGTAALGTIYTSWGGVLPVERAVAIIPGGSGPSALTCTSSQGLRPSRTDSRISNALPYGSPRPSVRCWQGRTGQYVYVVDLESGRTIAKLGVTGSPVVGSPSMYIGTLGSISTRAYVGDADGGVWRLDMSDPSPTRWQFSLAFDAFYDTAFNEGQPIVAPPIVSPDRNGDLLIAVGSGDPDLLEGRERNRVAVYREALQTTDSGQVTAVRISNTWELKYGVDPNTSLYEGERLTGPMSLFNGVLYFGSFVPSNSANLCDMGFSRLWGVDQTSVTSRLPDARLDMDGNPATTTDVVRVTRDLNGNGSIDDDLNSVLFGVGVIRQPSCVSTTTTADPYFGGTRQFVDGVAGGEFRLVAQTGRGGAASGGARTNVISRRLPPPQVQTQVNSWAVVFE